MRKVLEVTLEQLAQRGFERLSVPEVARLAGLNKTSVYRRWPTKEELVREALTVSLAAAPEDVPDTGSLRSDLLALARGALAFVESPLGAGVLRTLFAEGAHPEVRTLAASMFRQQETEVPRTVFDRAVGRGELPAEADVRLLLSTVAGALMHRAFVEQEPVTDAYLEQLIDLLLNGLVQAPARRRR